MSQGKLDMTIKRNKDDAAFPDDPLAASNEESSQILSELPQQVLEDSTRSNVYIKGLSQNVDDEALELLCRKYGKIVSCKIMMDVRTQTSKGVGFVRFTNKDDALNCINNLRNQSIDASWAKLSVAKRISQLKDDENSNVYISKLPPSLTLTDLAAYFSTYNVRSTKILTDPVTNLCRGVGFVLFGSHEEAQRAINEMSNKIIFNGQTTPLQMRFADTPKQKHLKRHVRREREKHALASTSQSVSHQASYYGFPYYSDPMQNPSYFAHNRNHYDQNQMHSSVPMGYVSGHEVQAQSLPRNKHPERNSSQHSPIQVWSPYAPQSSLGVSFPSNYMSVPGFPVQQQYYQEPCEPASNEQPSNSEFY